MVVSKAKKEKEATVVSSEIIMKYFVYVIYANITSS